MLYKSVLFFSFFFWLIIEFTKLLNRTEIYLNWKNVKIGVKCNDI